MKRSLPLSALLASSTFLALHPATRAADTPPTTPITPAPPVTIDYNKH